MTDPRAVRIAVELQLLGVSQAGVIELLSQHPYEEIERQLSYMPFRRAKRPEAFIMEAVRNRYSPPKELLNAKTQAPASAPLPVVDQGSQPHIRPADANPQGHGTPRAPRHSQTIDGLEPGGAGRDLAVPNTDR